VPAPARIQPLSPSLVNRIAAGEVIERPAAVVKELVENALDAGATQVQVDVEDGGQSLIRVVDDGGGIEVADLPLAFAAHATSKLSDDQGLFRIATMGFRGEALASIGSVSHARILSRTAESPAGYEILNRGGAISDPQASAGNVGTTVEVRHLFFNTPARRKFIKSAGTEYGHIAEMLLRLSLPFPHVGFRLTHNGRQTLDLPATTAEDRLLAAWPDDFRGRFLTLDVRDAELRLRGLVGLPELARPTAKYQYLYLNGRHVRDKFVNHALREAFRGLTEPGRQPAAVLLLEVPPADVDVNVHPTKVEVRFRDGGRIHGLVHAGVRERLLGSDLTPNAVPRPEVDAQPRQELRERLADFFRQPPATLPALASPGLAPPPIAAGSPFSPSPDHPVTPSPTQPFTSPPLPFTAIQLHNSYLVAQSDDGMVIIDQHALHERILYEDLLARVTRGPLESQRMLIPIVVPATARQLAVLDGVRPTLERLGLEVTPFGPDTVAVQAFPSFLHKLDPGEFVRELLERGEAESLDLHGEELLHDVLDLMACKAAVKAGDPLTPAEVDALLARRELVERSSNCPHGRPTTLRLSLRDLEKQFKRTGF
jgi:DNA mismatch repair protein MutL